MGDGDGDGGGLVGSAIQRSNCKHLNRDDI